MIKPINIHKRATACIPSKKVFDIPDNAIVTPTAPITFLEPSSRDEQVHISHLFTIKIEID